jgi:uncharacterized protein YkwD
MSALQTRTNFVWLLAAAVVFVLAIPGVAEAREWRAASALPVQAAKQEACQSASARIGEVSEAELGRATLCLLNQERSSRGLPRLRLNDRLSTAAERHSRDMVQRNYFSHDSLTGLSFVDRIDRSGYFRSARSWSAGENLAWGSGNRGTPEQILRAWMNSPGHRANILTRRFREVGIGVAAGAPVHVGGAAATYTTDFAVKS